MDALSSCAQWCNCIRDLNIEFNDCNGTFGDVRNWMACSLHPVERGYILYTYLTLDRNKRMARAPPIIFIRNHTPPTPERVHVRKMRGRNYSYTKWLRTRARYPQ